MADALLCISSYKYVTVSRNNKIQSNCAVCLRYSYLCLSPLPTVSLCSGIKQERGSEEKEDKCFCVMKTPSLFLSVSVSHSFSLLGQPAPAASLKLRTAWQADWLLACWFGWLPKLCFPACLKLDLSPLLDFASVTQLVNFPIYLHFLSCSKMYTGTEQTKPKQTLKLVTKRIMAT